jgi:hypothetical protein
MSTPFCRQNVIKKFPALIGFAGIARFSGCFFSTQQYDLSAFAVSLCIFWGTVAILSYML